MGVSQNDGLLLFCSFPMYFLTDRLKTHPTRKLTKQAGQNLREDYKIWGQNDWREVVTEKEQTSTTGVLIKR